MEMTATAIIIFPDKLKEKQKCLMTSVCKSIKNLRMNISEKYKHKQEQI